MESRYVHIVQLYPRDMNIYGDHGNVLTIQRQLQWRGFIPVVHRVNPGDPLPKRVDLLLGGGGQDSGQGRVQQDLLTRASQLRDLAEAGVPMLLICGLYQLFGHEFETVTGDIIEGIGLLDVHTIGHEERLIGNTVVRSNGFGELIGFENHSGRTYLGTGVEPLGRVTQGAGNNGSDGTEGARVHNVIGSYLHGSVLPKNPALTEFLIDTALDFLAIDQSIIQDAREASCPLSLETAAIFTRGAREAALRRPR